MPPRFLDRCYAGSEFLAYLTAGHFADPIPYYRDEDIPNRLEKSLGCPCAFSGRRAIRLDNNLTEAALRGPVIGKKAWLFLGNEESGEAAAIPYTLTRTCKRHCIDVEAFPRDVFRRIKDATPKELELLLPDRWIQDHPEARIRQRVPESQEAALHKRMRRARRRAKAGRR